MAIEAFGIDPASKFATELQAPNEEPRPGGAFVRFPAAENSVPSIGDSLAP